MRTEEEMIVQKFGEHVAQLRAKKQLTLRQVASQCKLTHSKVKLIESGKVNVTLLTMLELATGLGVSPKQLIDFQ
jgi:transcriptional regulator with XRE-family HTH domain